MASDGLPKRKSFSASEVEIMLITPDKEYLLGTAESFDWSREINAELQQVIGSWNAIDTLAHSESGSFSWSGALSSRDLRMTDLVPGPDTLGKWAPWDIVVTDRREGKVVVSLIGCVLNNDRNSITAGSKLMNNVSGIAAKVRNASELTEIED